MPQRTPDSRTVPLDHSEDLDLVRRTLRGEAGAIEAFARRMHCVGPMLASQNRHAGGYLAREELDDVVQETLTIIWKKRALYEGRASLETWAYSFSLLELASGIRRKRRSRHSSPQGAAGTAPEPTATMEPQPIDFDHLYASLERLGSPAADVVRLKHFEQLTFDEIGARLGMSPNTAKTHYYRALDKLRESMKKYWKEDEA